MPPDKKTQQENTNGILCFFFDRMGADGKRMESSRYWLPCSISNYTNGALLYIFLLEMYVRSARKRRMIRIIRLFTSLRSGQGVPPCASSSQVPYLSLPAKAESLLIPLLLLSPQNKYALRGPLTAIPERASPVNHSNTVCKTVSHVAGGFLRPKGGFTNEKS